MDLVPPDTTTLSIWMSRQHRIRSLAHSMPSTMTKIYYVIYIKRIEWLPLFEGIPVLAYGLLIYIHSSQSDTTVDRSNTGRIQLLLEYNIDIQQ